MTKNLIVFYEKAVENIDKSSKKSKIRLCYSKGNYRTAVQL